VRVAAAGLEELEAWACVRARPGADVCARSRCDFSSCLPWPEGSGGPPAVRPCGGARVVFGSVQTLGVRHEPLRSCTRTAGGAVTPTASRIRCLRFAPLVRRESPHDSALDARRATRGGRALTRQRLATCQRCQAFVGAIALGGRRG